MTVRRRLLLAAVACALAPAAARASGKKNGEGKGEDGPYLALPTMTATVIRPTGGRGVLIVQASLYITRAELLAKAQKSIPRLLDGYVSALQGWTYRMVPGAPPNVDGMAQVLQRETDRLLGPGARLLLGGVMVT